MSTRAGRMRRVYFQNFIPVAMRFMLWGLCLWFAAAVWQSYGVSGRIAAALTKSQGLPSALLNFELGAPELPAGLTPARMLLAMESGMPFIPAATQLQEQPSEPAPVSVTPEPAAPETSVEPGLSHTEPADDTPAIEEPPVQEPDVVPIEVTLTAGTGTNFLAEGSVVIRNETTINVDMEKVMARKLAFTLPQDGPQILIVHTHANEAFWSDGDDALTVVDIGARLAENLRGQGFEVLHDTTEYDRPDFNKSYSSALEGITKTLKRYPNIKIVLDIHRDAIQTADDVPRKPITMIDGEKVAQMMFVVGTNNSGLPHDNWPQNLCLAVQLQKLLAGDFNELMRPINLRRERFNQHATYGSLILEVGSYGNDGAEAIRAIDLFSQKAAMLFQSLKE